jgi:hypothetical protein
VADWPATHNHMNEIQHMICSWLHITHVLVVNLIFYGQTKNSNLNQIQIVWGLQTVQISNCLDMSAYYWKQKSVPV